MSPSSRRRGVIIHADDFGMASAVNGAIIAAWDHTAISSASLMIPTAGFEEAAAYARDKPGLDIGIHLTLTSEWCYYRWRPLNELKHVPTLVDKSGYFWSSRESFAHSASVADLAREMHMQIDIALGSGLRPTHIDCHMWAVNGRTDLERCFANIAREYSLPVALPKSRWTENLGVPRNELLLDGIIELTAPLPDNEWLPYYARRLRGLSPGVYQLVVHPGFNNADLQSIAHGCAGWGATWRQRDFNMLMSREFRRAIAEANVQIVNWNDLRTWNRTTGRTGSS